MGKNIIHIVERIKKVKGFRTEGEVAAALKMSLGALSNHKTRRSVPYEALSTFCETEKISLDWLLTGEGSPRPPAPSVVSEAAAEYAPPNYEDVMRRAAEIFREGDIGDRAILRGMIEEIYEKMTDRKAGKSAAEAGEEKRTA
jgi:hypothetical protein